MSTYVPPKKNTAYVFYVSLIGRSTGNLQANPTLASGDVKVAIDDGVPANLATLPVVDGDFTKRVKISLSASEMNGDNITVIFSDASGDEWYDLFINLQTAATQLDDIDTVVNAILNVDTYPEPGQGAPPATASLVTKISYLYKALRNKVTQTATEYNLYNDDESTVDQKATVSDDGTTFTREEMESGP